MKADGLEVYLDGNPAWMHHKVMVVDERVTIFGSFNFSANADEENDENVLVVDHPALALEFGRELRVLAVAQNATAAELSFLELDGAMPPSGCTDSAGALRVALELVGLAFGFQARIVGQVASRGLHAALDLVAEALGFALGLRGRALSCAFGLELFVASQLADAFLDVALDLVNSICHVNLPFWRATLRATKGVQEPSRSSATPPPLGAVSRR